MTDYQCCDSFKYLTLCNPMDCSPPGSSVHGIFRARILEPVVISSSRESSPPRDQTLVSFVSCIGRQALYQLSLQESPVSDAQQTHTYLHPFCPRLGSHPGCHVTLGRVSILIDAEYLLV